MEPQACIFFNLSKANQAALRFLARKVAELHITPVQAMVLGFLHRGDGVTSSALGKQTELDSATLTGILDRLEAAGHIRRHTHPHDRRSIEIRLTQEGKELAAGAVRAIDEANREFLSAFAPDERSGLLEMLGKLRDKSS
jgi:MarR family transcriptional regulator, organic hydroperoxide resistance regulator